MTTTLQSELHEIKQLQAETRLELQKLKRLIELLAMEKQFNEELDWLIADPHT